MLFWPERVGVHFLDDELESRDQVLLVLLAQALQKFLYGLRLRRELCPSSHLGILLAAI